MANKPHPHRSPQVSDFFQEYGAGLMRGPEAEAWAPWFALAYLPSPEKHPAFQVSHAHRAVPHRLAHRADGAL
jgi:hypothetical protein